jgi:hypothetical protein
MTVGFSSMMESTIYRSGGMMEVGLETLSFFRQSVGKDLA